VNKLFGAAMGQPDAAGATVPSPSVPASVASAASSAVSAASGSASGESTALITAHDVTHTFQAINKTVPAVLAGQFATLHRADKKATRKPPTKVPEILAKTKVADALTDISSYIEACQPTPSD
jgi:long-subunit fatty acid transport protein